ncbi:hypothetical protein LTS08_002675 [Lithohypha guttulata]|nr:hypothetical protein LTS08_002675 [Lithohypha guttulata]
MFSRLVDEFAALTDLWAVQDGCTKFHTITSLSCTRAMQVNIRELLSLSLFLIPLLASPIEVGSSFAESAGLDDSTAVKIISLRRSKHDLQHSSRALRNVKRAQGPVSLNSSRLTDSESRIYQKGYAILRATAATFLAPISIGGQSFLHVLDTGSADTWVASSSFECLDVITRKRIPRERCYFGPTYTPDSNFRSIEDQNSNITYGDGEFLIGTFGTVDVTLAGITVSQQQISLAEEAGWQGDGITSGIIGLAFPALTAAYVGTDPTLGVYCRPGGQGKNCNQIIYPSLIDNMFFKQQLTKPVFALALSRDENGSGFGGFLTIGGIPQPDLVGVTDLRFATTEIDVLSGDDQFRYYSMSIEGLVMLPAGSLIPDGNTLTRRGRSGRGRGKNNRKPSRKPKGNDNNNTTIPITNTTSPTMISNRIVPGSANGAYILDSGKTLSFIPNFLAQRYNSLFDPPTFIDPSSGFYVVTCDAVAPPLGVQIDGIVFWHNPKDLVKRFDVSGRYCISGIQSAGALGGVNILGDVFLNNVLAVFDLGEKVISFAARREYVS